MTQDPVDYHSTEAENFAEDYPLEDKSEAFFDLLETFVDLVEDGKVLDAGCGPGHETDYFSRHDIEAVGIDAAEGMIEYARENNAGDFHVMDLRDLDLEDETFDGVWCIATMQFFPPDEREIVLDELDRVLKPDGILHITFKMGEGSIMTEDYGKEIERYLIPEDKAIQTLEDRGYTIIETDRAELKWGLEVLNVFCRNE